MVKIKIKAKDGSSLEKLKQKLKRIKPEFNKAYAIELKKQLLNPSSAEPYIAMALAILSEIQSEYWGGSGLASQEDPTKVTASLYGEALRSEILKNFATAAKTIDDAAFTINIVLISNQFLGIGMEGDDKGTKPIQWLSHFLLGNLESDLYWVNAEHYEIFKGQPGSNLGRFGVGHLWKITGEESAVLNAKLKRAGKSYTVEALKHPQSGKAGRDWFSKVWDAVDFYSLVQAPALNAAFDSVQYKLFK